MYIFYEHVTILMGRSTDRHLYFSPFLFILLTVGIDRTIVSDSDILFHCVTRLAASVRSLCFFPL